MPFNPESDSLDLKSQKGQNGDNWLLDEQVVYFHPASGVSVCAHKGMLFDLASIPAVLRPFVSNDDRRIHRPAAIHDAMYRQKGLMSGFYENGKRYPPRILARVQADAIFFDALREEGVSWIKAKLMHLGVRAGGWMVWRV